MKKLERNPIIDIIKGIGIVLMVAGHAGFPLTRFIYLFHMSIFFIASGYCFNSNYSSSFFNCINFVKKRFLSLWLPFVVWTAIFSFLHNVFISLNIYTVNPMILDYENIGGSVAKYWTDKDILVNICKSFLLSGGTRMGGALWFICILMKISLLYCFMDYCIKKMKRNNILLQGVVSILFLICGYFFHLYGISFLSIDKVFSYYCLFYIGFSIKNIPFFEHITSRKKHLFVFFITFFILIICNHFGTIELDKTEYMNPVFLIVTSICGWYFIYEISFFIQKIQSVSRIFLLIGRNTMPIVILHFLCFKIVNLLGIIITNSPRFLLACFPTYMKNGCWWLIYTVVGVFVPVLLNFVYKFIKQKLMLKMFTK